MYEHIKPEPVQQENYSKQLKNDIQLSDKYDLLSKV